MANPAAVTLQQRLIAIKTGFEALLGSGQSREVAKRLRALFADATQPAQQHLPWIGLTWSPRERELWRTLRIKGQMVPDLRSELEDWFMALADARNAIIHEGVLAATDYAAPPERPLSRYGGPLFWKGERVLREAVKARLGTEILLCGLLREQRRLEELAPELFEAFQRAARAADEEPTAEPAGEEHKLEPIRTVPELLGILGARAANEVLLKYHSANLWRAKFNGKSEVITAGEKNDLEAAGAEEQLRPWAEPCP